MDADNRLRSTSSSEDRLKSSRRFPDMTPPDSPVHLHGRVSRESWGWGAMRRGRWGWRTIPLPPGLLFRVNFRRPASARRPWTHWAPDRTAGPRRPPPRPRPAAPTATPGLGPLRGAPDRPGQHLGAALGGIVLRRAQIVERFPPLTGRGPGSAATPPRRRPAGRARRPCASSSTATMAAASSCSSTVATFLTSPTTASTTVVVVHHRRLRPTWPSRPAGAEPSHPGPWPWAGLPPLASGWDNRVSSISAGVGPLRPHGFPSGRVHAGTCEAAGYQAGRFRAPTWNPRSRKAAAWMRTPPLSA